MLYIFEVKLITEDNQQMTWRQRRKKKMKQDILFIILFKNIVTIKVHQKAK